MKTVRRMPRKVGSAESEDFQDENSKSSTPSRLPRIDLIEPQLPADVHAEPVTFVKRPAFKPKKPSNLRTSFAPADDEAQDDTGTPSLAVKRPLKRNTKPRAPHDRESSAELPLRASADRPSYSASHLAELKSSTPATPSLPNRSSAALEPTPTPTDTVLDIASKFGSSILALSRDPLTTSPQHIPTDAEIREKKERRRRLALEEKADDYISLDSESSGSFKTARAFDRPRDSNDDDDEYQPRQNSNLIIPADDFDLASKPETRLERDDEDIAEGFDAFVEDEGKVTLKGRAAQEQVRQRRKGIAEQIKAAQFGYGYNAGENSGSDEEGDEEEVERSAAYEAAQTRAGTFGLGYGESTRERERDNEERERRRLEMPRVTPVPEFKVVVARFAELVRGKEEEVAEKRRRLGRVRREQVEIGREEERVKMLLIEAGERFEKLRGEAVGAGKEVTVPSANGAALETYKTVAPESKEQIPILADDSSEDERPAFAKLGSLGGRMAGFGAAGMAAMPKDDDEDDYY